MIRDTAMHVNLIFCIFFNRGGNFNKDYDRKMVTKVWLDSVGLAFISVFCRNIVHFLKGLIYSVVECRSEIINWQKKKKFLINILKNKRRFYGTCF